MILEIRLSNFFSIKDEVGYAGSKHTDKKGKGA